MIKKTGIYAAANANLEVSRNARPATIEQLRRYLECDTIQSVGVNQTFRAGKQNRLEIAGKGRRGLLHHDTRW